MKKVIFPHIGWYLLLLVPITVWGFFPSYFSRLFGEMPLVYHVHAFFMICWVIMAVLQPFLIRLKKTKLHRLIGRFSYFMMPLVFISAYWVMRHGYYNAIEAAAKKTPLLTAGETQAIAAASAMIGFIYLAWLVTFYTLAVINRKKILFHATYMFAAILTILGPTADRLIYNTLLDLGWRYSFLAENFVFLLNLFLLSLLLLYQLRKGSSVKPVLISIGIYATGVAVFFILPGTSFWSAFMRLIF